MSRDVIEGLQSQGANEEIQYSITPVPVPVSVVSVTVRDLTTDTVVTPTVMPAGSAVISSGAIVLPILKALTAGHLYEIAIIYSDGTSKIEPLIRVLCN